MALGPALPPARRGPTGIDVSRYLEQIARRLLQQPQGPEAGVAVAADDHVIVDGDAERARCV